MGDDIAVVQVVLARVEEKLDHALADHEKIIADHEARLRRLERMTYVAVGLAVAGGSSGLGALLSVAGG